MTAQVDFLAGLRCRVIGDGAAALTAHATLVGLGAEVLVGADGDSQDPDVVICDRVADGTDAGYLSRVEGWIASRPSGRPGAWVTVSAFGLDGPLAGLPGSDLVCAAAGGMLAALTDADGRFHQMPGEQALQATGLLSVLAALHGISLSRGNGVAVHQDLSAQEATVFSSVQQELAHILYRCGGAGGAARYSAPAGVFECADGLINIIVIDDHQFARVAEVVDRPDWVQLYPTLPDRVTHGETINAVVAEWLGSRPKVECERLMQGNGVPATAVRTVDEVNDSEQFRARGWSTRSAEGDGAPPLPAIVTGSRSTTPSAEPATPGLETLRVLELTNVLAGPLSGAILGAMGADVIRLEDRGRLDVYRRNGPFADGQPGIERAAYFACANYSKRSVSEGVGEDPDIARLALGWANVLIENVGSSRLARLGVGTPKVGHGAGGMFASISGYGRSGPHEDFRGYAPNVHAYAGLTDAIHRAVGSRVYLIGALADYAAAIWVAVLTAAWYLGGAKDDQRVDLSMAEAVAVKLRHLDREVGSAHDDLLVSVAGGPTIALSVPRDSDRGVAPVAKALRRSASCDDGENGEHLGVAALVARALAADSADSVVSALQAAGIAAHVVRLTGDVVTDPQLRARRFFLPVDHPVVKPAEIITLPWKAAGQPRTGFRPAPLLGDADGTAREAFADAASDSRRKASA
jgi:crotonobetainyl-CoA:carnitine CoA-transferase CaiB-like acyl-CoA transferase